MLLDTEIEVTSNRNTVKYYQDLGYDPPPQGGTFKIKTEHLPKSSRQKLRVKCSVCGGESLKSPVAYWGNLERNSGVYRCNTCAVTERNKAGTRSLEAAHEVFKAAGLKPLFTTYTENKELLPYECPNHLGNIRYKSLANVTKMIQKGIYGCPICTNQIRNDKQRTPFEKVKEYFSRFDVTLLSDASEYKTVDNKMRFICHKHPFMGEQLVRVSQVRKCKNICWGCVFDQKRGANNPKYKLGAELTIHLRQALQYWRTSSLELFDYTCEVTGERGGKLVVHHVEPQYLIRNEILDQFGKGPKRSDYTEEELAELTEAYVIRHYEQPIAAVITEDIHRLYHSIYGHKKNNTIQNFYDFKRRYQAGEYNKESN